MQQGNTAVQPWMRETLREGYTRLSRRNFAGASECCRRLLTAKPDLTEGHFLVGLIAAETDNTRMAVQAFGSVTRLHPDHGAAWAQLARLFMRMGHVNRADDALAKAVAYQDGNPVVQDTIASVHTLLGDPAEASQWLSRALDQQPENLLFLLNRANNQMFLGEFAAAQRTLEQALDVNPENANAHWLLSGLNRACDREHVDQLRALLQDGTRSPLERAYLNYALGKELEDLEDWSGAFDAFARGAQARRSTLVYDEAAERGMFDALEKTFTAAWLASCPIGHATTSPIFVVGQPRTGTTLIERIITAHPAVHSAGELRQFDGSLRRLLNWNGTRRNSAELVQRAGNVDVRRLGEAYMSTTHRLRGNLPHFVDKLPANYRYLPLILAALPGARIVHVRRDPMDACFASFKQLFADAYPHSYRQEELARHHARYYRLMAQWRARFGGRYHEIAYEAVAADPEPHARALIRFLGLPWNDACLDFHRQTSAVTTASVIQVREAAHTRSVGRWRRYEQQLQPLRRSLEAEGIPLVLG
ncbi:MAG: sulfotransferase [Chromatocurvus sp.]